MLTILILVNPCGYLTGCTPLLVLLEVPEFWTLFVGPDATLKADLVLIGERLTGGVFTFCFTGKVRECEGSATGIEPDTARMGSLGVMSCCTGLEAGYLDFRCSYILQRADLF